MYCQAEIVFLTGMYELRFVKFKNDLSFPELSLLHLMLIHQPPTG